MEEEWKGGGGGRRKREETLVQKDGTCLPGKFFLFHGKVADEFGRTGGGVGGGGKGGGGVEGAFVVPFLSLYPYLPPFLEKLVHPPHLRPKKGKTFSRFANSALSSPPPMYFF